MITAFAAQGTPVDMVSIGNEIRNGILWPVGQVDWTADTGWDNLTTLLNAGVAGARQANPAGHKLLVMLHFDEGGNNADSVRFFDHMVSAGVPFDVIGLSYYTFFHGPVTAMRGNVDDLATRYGKPIVIAESQYPWTLANGDSTGNFVWNTSHESDGYPATPGGQVSFYNDLLSILHQVPNHLGAGLFYWEPEWIPGVGWEPGAGTPNDNLTLFSFTGQALPSVGLFEGPLRSAPATTPSPPPARCRTAPARRRPAAGRNQSSRSVLARGPAPRSDDRRPRPSCAPRTTPGSWRARPAGASAAARSGVRRARTPPATPRMSAMSCGWAPSRVNDTSAPAIRGASRPLNGQPRHLRRR